MKPLLHAIWIAGVLALASPALADGMEVKPGKWEFKTTSQSPMAPAPKTQVETHCVTESKVDPATFMRNSNGCQLSDAQASSSSMSWKMACKAHGGQMTGDAVWIRGTATYNAAGVPPLVLELEETVTFEGDRISRIEDFYTPEMKQKVARYLADYGAKLGIG